jgi:hypothetical protein
MDTVRAQSGEPRKSTRSKRREWRGRAVELVWELTCSAGHGLDAWRRGVDFGKDVELSQPLLGIP